ncbi:MAG: hypothetical protein FJ100_11130 [Deltaproteobacteria bacterium]|nr:hypothetical protein [Deltaproteobacteria bacterium]
MSTGGGSAPQLVQLNSQGAALLTKPLPVIGGGPTLARVVLSGNTLVFAGSAKGPATSGDDGRLLSVDTFGNVRARK